MIRSFRCAETETLSKGIRVRRFANIEAVARRNDQWRVCFRWSDAGAEDVEIVDYH